MYQGMVDTGVVDSRDDAKIGMLGAMYGGTTGHSALVRPRLASAFPQAIALVEAAARAGERGERVATRLGRGSPMPGSAWHELQDSALEADADPSAGPRALRQTRAWGRFTRNFIVQGTAAEWAMCWLALIRQQLWQLPVIGPDPERSVAASLGRSDTHNVDTSSLMPDGAASVSPLFAGRAHLVFFLHDEVIVHTPAELAPQVEEVIRDAARRAGELLFGDFPVDFPLSVATVENYAPAQ
jgi:DNA polymerase-1